MVIDVVIHMVIVAMIGMLWGKGFEKASPGGRLRDRYSRSSSSARRTAARRLFTPSLLKMFLV